MEGSNPGTLTRRGMKSLTGMRRQRSLEWRQERGYSSSDEDLTTRPLDSHVFASLLAQAQQEYSCLERSYRSDETEDAATTDNPTTPFPTPPPTAASPRSPNPLQLRQSSPFPLENTNSRRIHYAAPQDRLRTSNGEAIYATTKKAMMNNTLGRSGRRKNRGMTSSSSATSCNSCNENRNSITGQSEISFHDQQDNLDLSNDGDSPPEPAPPEIPPRGPSLHNATLRRRTEYALPVTTNNQINHDTAQYITKGANLPDAIKNGCEKCSEKHKAMSKKVLIYILKNKPDLFKKVEDKYDPEGVYRNKYRDQLKAEGINID